MRRYFGDAQRMSLLATALTQRVAASDVDRQAALEVRQRKVRLPVAAEGRAEQREQRLVLIDRQELTVRQRPSLRREDEAHNPDLGQERLGHRDLPSTRLPRQAWPPRPRRLL